MGERKSANHKARPGILYREKETGQTGSLPKCVRPLTYTQECVFPSSPSIVKPGAFFKREKRKSSPGQETGGHERREEDAEERLKASSSHLPSFPSVESSDPRLSTLD